MQANRLVIHTSVAVAIVAAVAACGSTSEPGRVAPEARLAQCGRAEAEAVVDTVGPGGANLQLRQHKHRHSFRIPPGALPVGSVVRMAAPASDTVKVDIKVNGRDTASLTRPARLTMDYSACRKEDVDSSRVRIYLLNPDGSPAEDLGGVKEPGKKVRVDLDHLSPYALGSGG